MLKDEHDVENAPDLPCCTTTYLTYHSDLSVKDRRAHHSRHVAWQARMSLAESLLKPADRKSDLLLLSWFIAHFPIGSL